jgi:hypothetical protein
MQPLLRRLALLIHRKHGTEGHAFQRRYYSSACRNPEYLRNAIVYVHLNAFRAGLHDSPEQHPWSMHHAYCAPVPGIVAPERGAISGLRLFAPAEETDLVQCGLNYRAFLNWRVGVDAIAEGRPRVDVPTRPVTEGGDLYWVGRFGSVCLAERPFRPRLLDLRDLALAVLREVSPDMNLELLRSGGRTRLLVAVRRQLIVRAKENGHRHRSIARFLRISDVTVSRS